MYEEKDIDKSLKYSKVDEGKIDSEKESSVIVEDKRAETSFDSDKLIKERKKKVINFFKNKQTWVIGFLIIAIILGVYIRSMPMHDHGGNPGLWDITTNDWTLGPDLDPWLFTRYAETIVSEGGLPEIDMFRNVPLGFETAKETTLLPYMIVLTHKIVNLFGDFSVNFSAAIFPVIMFALTIISFFLFIREIFIRKSRDSIRDANIIALISTFFMMVIPTFLSRTIAGIPEKESAAFFFMFLAFYLFLRAWKSEKLKSSIILGILAGIATGMMGLIWGGVIYVFIPIGVASLVAFIFNQVRKKEFIVYTLWLFFSFSLRILFSDRTSLINMITSLNSGIAFLVFIFMVVHFILWYTKISEIKLLKNSKLPKNLLSIIIAILFILILGSIFLGPGFFVEKFKAVHQNIFKPTVGRWNTTVAENRQPYFTEWGSSFGPFIKNIPVLFWLFFIGTVVFFKKMLDKIKNKDSWILTGLYILFFLGLVFSRYSSEGIFNGENFISKSFYYISVLLFAGYLIRYYILYRKENNDSFEKIDFEYLILFALTVFTVFTVRGAVRLIMVLAPISSIFVGFLIIFSIKKFRKSKDETGKILLGLVVVLILISSIFVFWTFYNQTRGQAYNFVPSAYNQQWQKAMYWVRQETPQDSVFGHWWDYGYWLQSIGNRATALDGGNAIPYWNYLMGRLVLTGDNQEDALEFLYNHDVDYFLIDSTDIGKYGAFSSIGSDENFDRYSWIGNFLLDESQIQETNNQTIYVYPGGISLDEDLIIYENEKEVMLPKGSAGVGAIIVPVNSNNEFQQPYSIMVYQNKQHQVNLRYLYINGNFIDFNSGIDAAAYVYPRIIQSSQGLSQNPIGVAMYLSPRLLRGMLTQKYILNDPFNNFPNFKLVHTEQSLIVDSLNSQGLNLPDFVYYQGVQGPIKIWKIEYTGNEKTREDYLDKDYTKYISWEL